MYLNIVARKILCGHITIFYKTQVAGRYAYNNNYILNSRLKYKLLCKIIIGERCLNLSGGGQLQLMYS